MSVDLLTVKPFEICSIRPPTENSSLTFRLTRNCYWNRCAFCPVYKCGARFSKRGIDEVAEDIRRARLIDELMFEQGIGFPIYHEGGYEKVARLVERIEHARWEAGIIDDGPPDEAPADLDPKLAWFLPWFKDRPGLLDSFQNVLSWRIGGSKTCFLGDADSLVLKPAFLKQTIGLVKESFPTVERFTVYGRTASAARLRSFRELRAYRDAGLHRVHFGMESGSDRVLALARKGITKAEHIEGLQKTREAGLSCSVYVMPGLGGMTLSDDHARETADVISKAAPDFVRLRTLQIFPGTPLDGLRSRGEFAEADEDRVVGEIRTLVESIDCDTVLMSDSATNLLPVQGRLPGDRPSMLARIDAYLSLPKRERLEFSLKARISSFHGQYGGLSRDIYARIAPFLKGGSLELGEATDEDLVSAITLIREKLMP
ncbi:MAG TPA: radical SAM protein [Deltaproteobacteria bacterium]|jgi:hypothetical protein|nr:radical SAM protein [Deltaproteobacteria bacterium]HOI07254.1 radical SAM protein [Deltaproteobacteria bacterium]